MDGRPGLPGPKGESVRVEVSNKCYFFILYKDNRSPFSFK